MDDVITNFLSVGYGDGNGCGNGYGNGYGYGYGYGNGYGNGYGYGYGNGSGDGYGNGYGYGYGYGNGSGSGDGDGDGNGIKEINGYKVYKIDNVPTIIISIHSNIARGCTLRNNVILVPCYIAKVDNYFGHATTIRQAVAEATNKALRYQPIEDRIDRVITLYPDIDALIPNAELFSLHNLLTGSCEFGRKEFCKSRNLNPNDGETTMRDFIALTINAYGGDIIKRLKEAYDEIH